jgi:large subunit ribosomal protein L24
MKIHKGDKVKVTTGKFKGTIGLVVQAFPREGKVTVEGVNVKKKGIKKTDATSSENFVFVQSPINASNVMLVEGSEAKKAPKTSKPAAKSKTNAKKPKN